MLPRPMRVVCRREMHDIIPKRPRNSSRGLGLRKRCCSRSDTAGFTATRISSEPMNSARVV